MSTGACDLGEMNERRKEIAQRVESYSHLEDFEYCPLCETPTMRWETSHYRCTACSWISPCCW